jgi:hypothetical protein
MLELKSLGTLDPAIGDAPAELRCATVDTSQVISRKLARRQTLVCAYDDIKLSI